MNENKKLSLNESASNVCNQNAVQVNVYVCAKMQKLVGDFLPSSLLPEIVHRKST